MSVVLPNQRGVTNSAIARSSFPTCRPEAAKGSSGGNSTYNDLRASPYRKAVLTSAGMIDLLVPVSHFVIAREITVRIAIRPGIPANNSPRLSPVLNSRAARRALAIGYSSVPLSVNHPLDADHFSFFVLFHGFPCDNTIHLHPLESFHLFTFPFKHHFLTHTIGAKSQLN